MTGAVSDGDEATGAASNGNEATSADSMATRKKRMRGAQQSGHDRSGWGSQSDAARPEVPW